MRQIIDCIQGSEEWYQARIGRVTSSCFDKVLNKKTGRGLYMRKVAAEWISNEKEDSYTNAAMEKGKEREALARAAYETERNCKVDQVGLIILDNWIGCSPDGLVGDDGLIEIKCPFGSTHIQYIEDDKLPSEYVPQIQGQLWVTDRKWCDFISYHPAFNIKSLFIKRVDRDEKYIENLKKEVDKFVDELQNMIAKLQGE